MRTIISNIEYIRKKKFNTGDVITSGYGEAVIVNAEAGAVRCNGLIVSNLCRYNWRLKK